MYVTTMLSHALEQIPSQKEMLFQRVIISEKYGTYVIVQDLFV